MAYQDDVLGVLRSIDTTLKAMLTLAQQRTRASQPKAIASDRDLDGPHGNPEVRFNPRDWIGESYKGRRMSECPAAFLEQLADAFDWSAGQAERKGEQTTSGKPVAEYKRADAARARGWARRNAAKTNGNGNGPPPAPSDTWGTEDAWS